MTRLSLRLRLTLVFAVVMALLLTAVGAFLYVRLGNELDAQLEHRLAASVATLRVVFGDDEREVTADVLAEEEVAQVIGADGHVVAATAAVAGASVLAESELAEARNRRLVLVRRVLDDDPVLLIAEPLDSVEGSVLVVGASLESRDDAINGLLTQLLIGIPAALLFASLAGYALAGAALRPVEAMRVRAETISAEQPGGRLPLPPARDELRRLGETLNAMLARLEDGLERERRLVADASHELRTPLAMLRTELDLALRRPRTREELVRALRSASEETDRLARLADDLLLLARSDRGRLALRLELLDAGALLDAVAGRFEMAGRSRGTAVTVSGGSGVTLTADRARLEQAVGNLVDNALHHGAPAVELSAYAEAAHAVVRVRDRGPGFPPGFLPHAFERFSRSDEARTGSAAGLGLAIVEAIAIAHGGSATASNAPDGGAVVQIHLPAVP